jgi:hypothetical protein
MSDWPETAHAAPDDALAEQASAFALDALPAAEAAPYRRHLAACAVCRALVAEQRAVVDLLPLAVDDGPVDAERVEHLRARILAAARAEPQVGVGSAVPATPARPPVPIGRPAAWYRRPVPAPWAGLGLAASLLLLLGLLGWNLSLQRQLGEEAARSRSQTEALTALVAGGRAVPLAASPEAGGARGTLIQAPGQTPVLLVHGLAAAPSDKIYEIWWIRGGAPSPAGTFRPLPGETTAVPVTVDPAGAQQVAVSLEAAHIRLPSPAGPVYLAGGL